MDFCFEKEEKLYIPKAFILATLPHSKNDLKSYKKSNGNFSLEIVSNHYYIPYGVISRLIIMFITTFSIRNKTNIIVIDKSDYRLMKSIAFFSYGLKDNNIRIFLKNMRDLLFSKIKYKSESEEVSNCWSVIEDNYSFKITLSDEFYKDILINRIYFYRDHIMKLRNSPFSFDLYIWSIYRRSYIRSKLELNIIYLCDQFGSNYKEFRNFKEKLKKAIKKIQTIDNSLNIKIVNNNLILMPI